MLLLEGIFPELISFESLALYLELALAYLNSELGDRGLLLAVVVVDLLVVVRLVSWIWQTFNAHSLANKYNAELERTGRPPW
jgi:hypothetical protein